MGVNQKRLAGPTQLTTSNTVQYTTPINATTVLKQIVLCNTTSSAKTVTIRLKPAGVTEANTHDFMSAFNINANETISFGCSIVLTNDGNTSNATSSDQIIAFASSNSSVNVMFMGFEES
jgi:hypothetical protein